MLDFNKPNSTPVYRFEREDEVIIQGRSFKPYFPTADGYSFEPVDGNGPVVPFDHETLAAWVNRGDLIHNPGKFSPHAGLLVLNAAASELSLLNGQTDQKCNLRYAFVQAFLEMEQRKDGSIKRTEKAVQAAMHELCQLAYEYYEPTFEGAEALECDVQSSLRKKSAGRILKWVRSFELHGLAGLVDERAKRGNRNRRMTPEELSLLGQFVQKYLSPQRPSMRQIFKQMVDEFKAENRQREADGRPLLEKPSYETLRKQIKKLDPFHVTLARKGKQAALREFAPVGRGNRLSRPLQRVEMDEWKIDLISLLNEASISKYLTADELAALEQSDKKKRRWWISVAICCTTRCVLAMRLMLKPSTASALETIEMAISDKGIFCDAVGARTPWNMFGGIEHLVTDCGPAFKSKEFRAAMSDLGIPSFELAPAGIPHLRAQIERIFRTLASQLMPLLSGRTFSDVIARGDHDPEADAVLTPEELATALVRYVVDIYHNSPHAGLNGETPFNCWQRLAKEGTLRPAPDRRRRRIVFGTSMTRKVQKTGIRVLNVQYHSHELAMWMAQNGSKEVQVRWHHRDIGEIEVCLDGVWQTVGAVQDGFQGVSAQTWTMAMRSLRSSHQRAAELAEETVFAAIRDIQAMNDNAIRRGDLKVDTWSPERLADNEDRLFVGFNVAARSDQPAPQARYRYGTQIERPAGSPARQAPIALPPQQDTVEAPMPPAPSANDFTIEDE